VRLQIEKYPFERLPTCPIKLSLHLRLVSFSEGNLISRKMHCAVIQVARLRLLNCRLRLVIAAKFIQRLTEIAAIDGSHRGACTCSDASTRARTELASQPEVLADVLMTLGRTYISLTEPEKAETNLRAGLEASLKAHGELHPTTAMTMGWLGLALAYRGKYEEGEKFSRRAVELQRRIYPRGHEDLGVSLYALGSNLISKGQAKAAQPILQEAVELIRKYLGENHGAYMASLTMLARADELAGNVERAEALFHQSIDVGRHVPARYRIFTAQAQGFLGTLLTNKGAYPEAEGLLRQSEALYREIFGGEANANVGSIKGQLGFLYFLQGDYTRAEEESRKALDPLRKFLGPENPTTLSAQVTLGLGLTRLDRAAEGEPYLRDALAIRQKNFPADDFVVAHTSSMLGECLTAQKRFEEAQPLLLNGYNNLKAKLGDQNRRTIDARQRLAKLYDDWGKPDQAAQFR